MEIKELTTQERLQKIISEHVVADLSQKNKLKNEPHEQYYTVLSVVERLKKAIRKRRPTFLRDIIDVYGDQNLLDYTDTLFDIEKNVVLDGRKNELIEVVSSLVDKRISSDVARGIAVQLHKLPLVSTSDHHGPINHPMATSTNIISGFPYNKSLDVDLQYLVVFSFGGVSLNNFLAYARGIEFHSDINPSELIRIPILPDKLKMGISYAVRSFTQDDLVRAIKELRNKNKEGLISKEQADKVEKIIETFFNNADVLALPTLAAQITKINFELWPHLFHPGQMEEKFENKEKIPDLVYVEIESIVTELLVKHHIYNKESILHKLLFDASYRNLALKHFNNLPGGFSLENKTGSFLFWAVDEKMKRVQLYLDNNVLRSADGEHEFLFTPESIEQALVHKKIIPGMVLCYLIIALYYGMKCIGGYCQVHDMTVLKESWRSLLREAGDIKEAQNILSVPTKSFGGDGLLLSYIKTSGGQLIPATAVDLLLEKSNTQYRKYVTIAQQVKLEEMVNPNLPAMYQVIYHGDERDESLLEFSPEEIVVATGLDVKLV